MLFVDILQIHEYPGSPFTGNIMVDLVQFFLIPTILLLIFVHVVLENIPIVSNMDSRLKLFFAIAVCLYIIVTGLFRIFALLAGPYFILVVFIIGFLYFIGAHFEKKTTPSKGSQAGQQSTSFLSALDTKNEIIEELNNEKKFLENEIERLEKAIKTTDMQIKQVPSKDALVVLRKMMEELRELKHRLESVKRQLKKSKKVVLK